MSAWIDESINWQKAEDAAKAEQDEAAARTAWARNTEPVNFSETATSTMRRSPG